MPELAEYQQLLARRAAEKAKHVHEQRTQVIPKLRDVAFKAQTVVDHPGWQFYLDSLETRIKEIEKRRIATAERMVSGTEMGKELELLKINLNAMDAEMAGLRFAQTLIPQAIEQGNSVITGVNGQAAAASIAG